MTGHRIPPPGEDLEFVRNTATGTVHVLLYTPKPWEDGYEEPERAANWGEAIVKWITGPLPSMLCGHRLRFGWPGSRGQFVSDFDAGDLCAARIRVLGDQSPRAFERGDPL